MHTRRTLLQFAAASGFAASPLSAFAEERRFAPRPGAWRTFELTTRAEPNLSQGATRVWLPIPSVDNNEWQRSLESSFTTNGTATRTTDGQDGAAILLVDFDASVKQPYVELTNRVQTRNRATEWTRKTGARLDAADVQYWTRPTSLIP